MSAVALITLGFFGEAQGQGPGETIIHIGGLEVEAPNQQTVTESSDGRYVAVINEDASAEVVEQSSASAPNDNPTAEIP